MVPIVYALLRSYLDFKGKFRFCPMLMPKPCSGDFKCKDLRGAVARVLAVLYFCLYKLYMVHHH